MREGGFLEQKRASPVGFTLVVAGHAAALAALLLIKGSGIPLLEKKADKKWGGEPDYEAYKKNTPVLIPKL